MDLKWFLLIFFCLTLIQGVSANSVFGWRGSEFQVSGNTLSFNDSGGIQLNDSLFFNGNPVPLSNLWCSLNYFGQFNYTCIAHIPNPSLSDNASFIWTTWQPINVVGSTIFCVEVNPFTQDCVSEYQLIQSGANYNLTSNITYGIYPSGLNYYEIDFYANSNTTLDPGNNLTWSDPITTFNTTLASLGAFNQTNLNGSTSVYSVWYSGNNSFGSNGTFFSYPFILNHTSPEVVSGSNWTWFEGGGITGINDPDIADFNFENDTKDASRYNNSGQVIGSVAFNSSCVNGGCYYFQNGSKGNYLNLSSLSLRFPNGAGSGFSIDGWINVTNINAQPSQIIVDAFDPALKAIGAANGYRVWVNSSGELVFQVWTPDNFAGGVQINSLPNSIKSQSWYEFAAVYQDSAGSANISLFLNGTYLGSHVDTGFLYAAAVCSPVVGTANQNPIGTSNAGTCNQAQGNNSLGGNVDTLQFWNRTLSITDVSNLYSWQKIGAQVNNGNFIHNFTNVTVAVRTKSYTFNDSSLLGWWDLGSSSDNETVVNKTLDLSGNGWNSKGINAGVKLNNSGVVDGALTFNGSGNSFIDIPFTPNSNVTNFTACFWIEPNMNNGTTNERFFDWEFDKGDGYEMGQTVANAYWFMVNNSGSTAFTNGSTNNNFISSPQWIQLCGTYNTTNAVLYANGVVQTNTQNLALTQGAVATDLFLGSTSVRTANFNGSMDDVKIWNRTLSQTEITGLYNNGCPTCAGGEEQNWTNWTTPDNNTQNATYLLAGNVVQARATLTALTTNYSAFLENLTLDYLNEKENVSIENANGTQVGTPTLFSILLNSTIGLTTYVFAFDNGSGTFVNSSSNVISGLSAWANQTRSINQTIGATIRFQWFYCDIALICTNTSLYSFQTTGPTPIYSNFTSNQTILSPPQFFILNATWWINLTGSVNTLSEYWVSENTTGSFVNDTYFNFPANVGTGYSNVTVTSPVAPGYYCYEIWANDSGNNLNNTGCVFEQVTTTTTSTTTTTTAGGSTTTTLSGPSTTLKPGRGSQSLYVAIGDPIYWFLLLVLVIIGTLIWRNQPNSG